MIDSMTNDVAHYVRTWREWRKRFMDKFHKAIVPILQKEYPDVVGKQRGDNGKAEIEIFKRKWIYFFSWAEFFFGSGVLGHHIITVMRGDSSTFGRLL